MSRTAWLAALVVILAPGRGPGQDVADEPPRAVGLRMVGAFGGQGNEGHKVRIEMEGGQTLEGLINSQPFIVDGDLGRYTIWAEKVRTIQFLKRSNVEDEPDPPPQPNRRNPQAPGMMGGMGGAMMMRQPTLVRGKVTTTTGKIIVGDIHIPPNFSLTLDFGDLAVAPEKLRTLTMIDAEADQPNQPAQPQNPPNAKPKPPNGPQPQGNTRGPQQNPSGSNRNGGSNRPDGGSKRPDKP